MSLLEWFVDMTSPPPTHLCTSMVDGNDRIFTVDLASIHQYYKIMREVELLVANFDYTPKGVGVPTTWEKEFEKPPTTMSTQKGQENAFKAMESFFKEKNLKWFAGPVKAKPLKGEVAQVRYSLAMEKAAKLEIIYDPDDLTFEARKCRAFGYGDRPRKNLFRVIRVACVGLNAGFGTLGGTLDVDPCLVSREINGAKHSTVVACVWNEFVLSTHGIAFVICKEYGSCLLAHVSRHVLSRITNRQGHDIIYSKYSSSVQASMNEVENH
ncbi:hypothetical protein ACLOJK_032253 [Asimina triloba]